MSNDASHQSFGFSSIEDIAAFSGAVLEENRSGKAFVARIRGSAFVGQSAGRRLSCSLMHWVAMCGLCDENRTLALHLTRCSQSVPNGMIKKLRRAVDVASDCVEGILQATEAREENP